MGQQVPKGMGYLLLPSFPPFFAPLEPQRIKPNGNGKKKRGRPRDSATETQRIQERPSFLPEFWRMLRSAALGQSDIAMEKIEASEKRA